MPQNCAGGTWAPYVPDATKPWNAMRVAHLYRRLGFGATPAEIQAGLSLTPAQLVDQLLSAAKTAPLPAPPAWYNWTASSYTDFGTQAFLQTKEWYIQWLLDMLNTGVREKIALFWHNHFVTRSADYLCPSYMYAYHKLLQQQALGNFKTFLKEMARTPAMLTFLDGRLNTKNRPNENYARELFELFTLGVNNGYTQQDITEAARALTGYTTASDRCSPISFNPADFDSTPKTIFGQTANFDFDGVHDLIFQVHPAKVAQFIATKVYTHFVHPIPQQAIIDGLADTFRNSNFEIEPMLAQLFKSDHFYEEEVISVAIKSPVDFVIGFIRESGLPYDTNVIDLAGYLTVDMGQQLFNPIDVSGWNGNRSWIDSNAITKRWSALSLYLDYVLVHLDKERFRQLAIEVSGNSADVAYVARSITEHFIPKGLDSPAAYQEATTALKYQVPSNYFDLGLWNLSFQYVPEQVWNLLKWVIRRPEFQLM
ncbi:MAG: hypothetical protein KatS3mg031_2634 [Chitinophagales bacterium]|nr:MAG: hypothetical protein KatS3mg031_2634 [Chitinophagales bacterium]